jgi:hypothetical protein
MKNIKLILLLGTLVAGTTQAMEQPKPAEKPRDEMSYLGAGLMCAAGGAAAGAWHTGEALKKVLSKKQLITARFIGMVAGGTVGFCLGILAKFGTRNT